MASYSGNSPDRMRRNCGDEMQTVSANLNWFGARVNAAKKWFAHAQRELPAAATLILLASFANVAGAQSIANGNTLWNNSQGGFVKCASCHGVTPGLPQKNTSGTRSVLNSAITNSAGGYMQNFAILSNAQRDDLAAFIGSNGAVADGTTHTVVVAYHSAANVITPLNLAVSYSGAFTGVIQNIGATSGPLRGTMPNITTVGSSFSYTHTANNCLDDTIQYRATGLSGATSLTKTLTVQITPPAAPTTSASSSNIAYSTSPINIPLTIGGGPNSNTITIISNPAVGTVNTAGLTATYTASSSTYAPSVTFSYRVNGPCANSNTSTVTVNVAAPPAPVINSSLVASGNGGQAFNYQITATNAPTSFNATGLPAGLSINTANGVISGTPTVSGNFMIPISATNGTGTDNKTLNLTINLVAPVITSANSAPATSGAPFSFQVTASNLPSSFNATGLPSGLSINTSTGLISGTPVVAMGGSIPVTLSATNTGGTGMQAFSINISLNPPTFTSANSAAVNSGQPINFQVTATDFPSAFGAAGLPPGISINTSTGLITGSTVVASTTMFPVTLTAMNGSGTTPQAFTLTVTLPPPAITSPATANGTATIPFSYQIVATNSPTSYNATGLPTGLSINTATGAITGTPTVLGTSNVTLSATNASGTGMLALTITISNQPTPSAFPVTISVPFNTATTFDLTAALSGNYTSVAITSQVSHGTLVLNGFSVTYTPNTGYFGQDSFAFTATGPGGTSAPATVTVQVGTPGAPVAVARSVTVTFNTATAIDLTSAITGLSTGVSVTTPPDHGTTSVSGKIVTYTPATGYFGDDVFSYTAVGPGGTSLPVDVTIKVTPLAPSGDSVTMILPLNTPTVLDLSPFVRGTALTGVAVVSAPLHGTVTVNGMKVTYTPKNDYFGADSFTYTAFGTVGKSSPATVKVTIVGRPDPAKDANVTGLLAAQSDAAQRFSRAQISNFQGRMETLHRSGDSGVAPPPGAAPAPAATPPVPAQTARANGTNNTSALDPIKPNADANSTNAIARANAYQGNSLAGPVPSGGAQMPYVNELASLLSSRSVNVASLVTASAGDGSGGSTMAGGAGREPLNFWISGVANFGRRVANTDRNQLDFTTDGLSLGVDRRFGSKFAAGVGVGFARDVTDIGSDGSKSKARSASAAIYASYHPTQHTFVDGLLGAGSLNFKTERYVTPIDAFASGDRSGAQLFASLAGGYEYRDQGYLLSPYVRFDYTSDRLNQSSETGAGQYALTYFRQTTPSLQGVLGFRAESLAQTNYGWATPRARIEYRREFQGDRDATIAYTDLISGARYAFSTGAVVRNALVVGIGADFIRRGGLTVGLDYQLVHNFSKDSQQGIRLNFTQDLDALGTPYAVRGFFSIPQKPEKIQFDAGFMFDSNVPRAKEESDKRADRAYSVNVGKGFVFKLEERENWRANVTVTLGGEKFQNFDGLSRRMAGIDANIEYKGSADFDAITYALFGRTSIERYRSSLRDGYRYTVGLSARRSLTDRIDVFAAIAHNERVGDSAVFSNRDNSARINFDYSLSDRETLYATGEYRRGQTFSSGRASLDNLDVAEVFVLDDAYPGSQFFAYRFDANTIISTVGYNLGFGPRHSLDLSWRRAKSTPRMQSGVSGTSSYTADQYSIVYLIRF